MNRFPLKIIYFIFVLIFGFTLIHLACEKKEQQQRFEQTLEKEELQLSTVDSLPPVDYGDIMNQLYDLQQKIKQAPLELQCRQALLEVAIDSSRNKLYAVGEGLPDTTLASNALQRQAAERAALVDAQRWALFALKWSQDPNQPLITDKVSGQVPPFRIVQKAQLLANKTYLLIEINL